MKCRLFLVCFLLHKLLTAQNVFPVYQDSLNNNKQYFSFSGLADYQSTSIGKDIVQSFFYGGFVDTEMKQESSNRHDEINRFGFDINAEFEYRNERIGLGKDSSFGLLFKWGGYNFSSTIYSKDLFDLAFFGNELFIGDTANLTGSEFNSMTFQKLGFGLIDKKSKSSLVLNLVGLNNHLSGSFGNSYLYQSQIMDSVSMEFSGSAQRAIGNSYLKGLGVALDVDYRFKMKKNEKHYAYFQLIARNLGFAVMNSEKYVSNTNLSYSSYQIIDFINSETIFTNTDELVSNIGDTLKPKTTLVFLPAMFQFTKLIDPLSSKKIQGFYGFRAYLTKAYIPMLFAGLDFRVSSWYRIGAQMSFGGFSQLRWGMYSSLLFKHFELGLASENLFSKTGQSIVIRLSCNF